MNLLLCDQAYEKKTTPKWRYDLGRKKNFEQVGKLETSQLFFFLSFLQCLHDFNQHDTLCDTASYKLVVCIIQTYPFAFLKQELSVVIINFLLLVYMVAFYLANSNLKTREIRHSCLDLYIVNYARNI